MQKNVPLVKQNVMKFEEDRELIRRERRDGREGEERGLRKGAERDREKRDNLKRRIRNTLASACCSASSRH